MMVALTVFRSVAMKVDQMDHSKAAMLVEKRVYLTVVSRV